MGIEWLLTRISRINTNFAEGTGVWATARNHGTRPNPKIQIPNPNKLPNLKSQTSRGGLEAWSLGFSWELGFGIWDFSGAAHSLLDTRHSKPNTPFSMLY